MALHLNRRGFLASTAGFLALHPFSVRAQSNQAHLRIMETTDLHVHVHPYDYYGDKPTDTVGLARTATIIRNIRDFHQYFGHYHTGGNPGRNEIDETQEIYYPPIMKAIAETGFQGYVAHEFVPKGDPLAALTYATRICDV